MARRKITNTLALAVLGLLQERPMHPYEMASTLRERHKDSSFKVNAGSLYDTVESLVRHGWIKPVETVRAGRRPERTVYTHTQEGRVEFVRWIDELIRIPAAEYPKFMAAVSYMGALGPSRAADALAVRATNLDRQAAELRQLMADTVGAGELPRLFMIEGEFALHALEAELTWVRQTETEIRDGTLRWPDAWPPRAGAEGDPTGDARGPATRSASEPVPGGADGTERGGADGPVRGGADRTARGGSGGVRSDDSGGA